jgi:hypothetical protein
MMRALVGPISSVRDVQGRTRACPIPFMQTSRCSLGHAMVSVGTVLSVDVPHRGWRRR